MFQQDVVTKEKLRDLENMVKLSLWQHVSNRCSLLMAVPWQHEKSHSVKNIFTSKSPFANNGFSSLVPLPVTLSMHGCCRALQPSFWFLVFPSLKEAPFFPFFLALLWTKILIGAWIGALSSTLQSMLMCQDVVVKRGAYRSSFLPPSPPAECFPQMWRPSRMEMVLETKGFVSEAALLDFLVTCPQKACRSRIRAPGHSQAI